MNRSCCNIYIFISLLSLFIASACTKAPKGAPGPNEIWLQYKSFNPSTISVKAGTTVTFINKDNADHWAKGSNGLFSSGKISSGDSYSYTFTTVGTFGFYCPYHSSVPAEQGYINVQ